VLVPEPEAKRYVAKSAAAIACVPGPARSLSMLRTPERPVPQSQGASMRKDTALL
jgi:hypothetical protein